MVKSNFDFEEVYAMRLMAFEKEQAKKGLRPPLPCTQRRLLPHQKVPAVVAMKEERLRIRRDVYETVLKTIADGEVIDTPTISERMDTTPQRLANYLRDMVDEGYLSKLSMPVGQFMYVYVKTGKKLK